MLDVFFDFMSSSSTGRAGEPHALQRAGHDRDKNVDGLHSFCLFWLWLVVKSVFINPLVFAGSLHPSVSLSITFTCLCDVASIMES
jgi:hypothetical protein